MKRKIGILTLNGYFNYGNRLQNYATVSILKKLGFEVHTIINDTSVIKKDNKIKEKNVFEIVKKIDRKFRLRNIKKNKEKKFKSFSSQYLNETNFQISKNHIPTALEKDYDYFVTGGDQVWNPYFGHGKAIDFLTFASKNKRIAFCPSFGISDLPEKYHKDYTIWLNDMHSLSVREKAGAEIIKKLTGREAEIIIDPTLMIDKEEWLNIAKKPINKLNEKYLLTYFLGDISKERENEIKRIAAQNKLKIIRLMDYKESKYYDADPSEFIYYINSASVFCTDSFHGAAFSIVLDTPFIVFNRESVHPSMNSRIETLLTTFGLESRLSENVKANGNVFDNDYARAKEILIEERKKFNEYLEKSIV